MARPDDDVRTGIRPVPGGTGRRPVEGADLRARFRSVFLAADPGDLVGEAALRDEALRLLLLRRMAAELLTATGAADLAEVYLDDPPVLAALHGVA